MLVRIAMSRAKRTSEDLQQLAEELSQYGLTTNQALTYIVLSQLPLASASEISRWTGKHHEETYRSLARLGELGLVSILPGRPTRYSAVPARTALAILVDKGEKKLSELKNRQSEVLARLSTLPAHGEVEVEDKGFKWTTEMAQGVKALSKAIASSEFKISLALSPDELEVLGSSDCMEALLAAVRKKIEVRLLTMAIQRHRRLIEKLGAHTEIRHRGVIPVSIGVFDQTYAMLSFSSMPDGARIQLWSGNKGFIESLARMFSDLWDTSVDALSVINLMVDKIQVPGITPIYGELESSRRLGNLLRDANSDIYGLVHSSQLANILQLASEWDVFYGKQLRAYFVLDQKDKATLGGHAAIERAHLRKGPTFGITAIASSHECVLFFQAGALHAGFHVIGDPDALGTYKLLQHLYETASSVED